MIPSTKIREITEEGVTDSTSFEISTDDSAHIMGILRDTLYSDKVLAVIREYSSNAWDAHRQAGKPTLPIKVTMPTPMEPTFTVRDYGKGLSHEDIFTVYTKYGKSTKRSTDDAVGMLGIGSKSGFAYSDTFTITTWHNGYRGVYVAMLDPSDKGELKLLDSGNDAGNETGIQIQIPVRPDDIDEFQEKAAKLFQWFDPRPEVNIDLPLAHPGKQLVNGRIDNSDSGEWVAVMGCIAYRVNVDQLSSISGFDWNLFHKLSGALYFKIGEVRISASREELKYDDNTKKSLSQKFNDLVDEYVKTVLDEIDSVDVTPWEKRLRAQVLHRLSLPIPQNNKDLFAKYITLKDAPKTFTMQRGRNFTTTFPVTNETRIVMQDDKRTLRGYGLGGDDCVIKALPKKTLEEVRVELTNLIESMGMKGIPTVNISTMTWIAPRSYRGGGSVSNIKHRVRAFKLKDQDYYHRPYSDNWEAETERVAEDTDVYVILHNFLAVDGAVDFYYRYRQDRSIAKAFGITMPVIYGYKTTEAKPVKSATGVTYTQWRDAVLLKQLDPVKAKELVLAYDWSHSFRQRHFTSENLKHLIDELGEDHEITQFAMKSMIGKKVISDSKFDDSMFEFLRTEVLKETNDDFVDNIRQAITLKYPLINISNNYDGLSVVWSWNSKPWTQYIKLIDKENK